MIKFLIQSIIVVVCLLILIPLVMLLVGEGALIGKLLDLSFPEEEEKDDITELVEHVREIKQSAKELKFRDCEDDVFTSEEIIVERW